MSSKSCKGEFSEQAQHVLHETSIERNGKPTDVSCVANKSVPGRLPGSGYLIRIGFQSRVRIGIEGVVRKSL